MFSSNVKRVIATKVQAILQETFDEELPGGEINFLLHVDGAEKWSWANIVNNGRSAVKVPEELIKNTTA